MPKNPDGSIRWFLYRWDDGKQGRRHLVQCRVCGRFYLVQAYRLNKFSSQKNVLFEDYYPVKDARQAALLNRTLTGPQLERSRQAAFQLSSEVTLCSL